MCRIAGIIDKGSSEVYVNTIRMRDAMIRGGPDHSGIYFDQEAKLGFGHNRLSIIDLSNDANQPFHDEAQKVVVCFNGEIYNYQSLKNQLIGAGFVFKSCSDTEVIVMAYKLWGWHCFSNFKGMFAIALYDQIKGELILARDHAGIKPLYYCYNNESLYFSSEIRGFKALGNKWETNNNWKTLLLTYGYIPEPFTVLKEVYALDKGTCLIFETNTLQSSKRRFYSDSYDESIFKLNEAKDIIRSTLSEAVKRHLISDAPLGVLLSGGTDSSILALLAAKENKEYLNTLSIDFEEVPFSEGYYQQLVAGQCNSKHHSLILNKSAFIDAFEDIIKAMDQPTADGVNTYFICRYARQCGLKTVISGIGADELLGGYPSFRNARYVDGFRKSSAAFGRIFAFLIAGKYPKIDFLRQKNALGEYLFYRGYFTPSQTAKLLNLRLNEVNDVINQVSIPDFINELSLGNKISWMEYNLYMQNQLVKDTDVMGMWHGVEVRVPFLDRDFIKAIHSIDAHLKYNFDHSKYLLVESYKHILPMPIFKREKRGFTLPFVNWMKDDKFQSLIKVSNGEIQRKFMKGSLSWSRYWAYAITDMF